MNAVDLEKLRTPFAAADLEWKVQRCGLKGSEPWAIIVPYVDARAIMKRLDEVAGPANWQSRLVPTANGMLCELSLRLGGEWITKMDGSDETDYEPFKGGISKALVRAAVHWGIGRDLYTLPTMFARFVDKSTPGAHFTKVEGKDCWWVPAVKQNSEATPPAEKTEKTEELSIALAAAAVNTPVPAVAREQVNRAIGPVSSMAAVAQGSPSSSRTATITAPRPAAKPVATGATAPLATLETTAETVVPFGHNQGKRLGELNDSELAGLADFYARVPEPKGKAKLFKRDFDKYMSARSRAS